MIVWAPLGSGFLTTGFDVEQLEDDDFRRTHPFGQREDLQAIRTTLGPDVTRGAVRFVLDHPQRLAVEGGGSTGGHEVADDALDVHRRVPPFAATDSTITSSGSPAPSSERSSSGGAWPGISSSQ